MSDTKTKEPEVVADENVVTTEDVAPKKQPKSFADLNKSELLKAAEYFGADTEGNAIALRASLEDWGVTWNQYVKAFKLEGHEDIPEQPEIHPLEVDEADLIDDDEQEVEELTVKTAEPTPKLKASDNYLIKFVGENPYFEFEKYKYTQDKPFAIMPADAAQRALEQEPKKFRQAFPKELQEYYG
jgi:hypothetical protein